jgi:hypothetical protein
MLAFIDLAKNTYIKPKIEIHEIYTCQNNQIGLHIANTKKGQRLIFNLRSYSILV